MFESYANLLDILEQEEHKELVKQNTLLNLKVIDTLGHSIGLYIPQNAKKVQNPR